MIIAVISVVVLTIVSTFIFVNREIAHEARNNVRYSRRGKRIVVKSPYDDLPMPERVIKRCREIGFKETMLRVGWNFIAAVVFVFTVWLSSVIWIYLEGFGCFFALLGVLALLGLGMMAVGDDYHFSHDPFAELMGTTLITLIACVALSMILYVLWFIWYWICGGILLDPIVGEQSVGDKIFLFLMSSFFLVYILAAIKDVFK